MALNQPNTRKHHMEQQPKTTNESNEDTLASQAEELYTNHQELSERTDEARIEHGDEIAADDANREKLVKKLTKIEGKMSKVAIYGNGWAPGEPDPQTLADKFRNTQRQRVIGKLQKDPGEGVNAYNAAAAARNRNLGQAKSFVRENLPELTEMAKSEMEQAQGDK